MRIFFTFLILSISQVSCQKASLKEAKKPLAKKRTDFFQNKVFKKEKNIKSNINLLLTAELTRIDLNLFSSANTLSRKVEGLLYLRNEIISSAKKLSVFVEEKSKSFSFGKFEGNKESIHLSIFFQVTENSMHLLHDLLKEFEKIDMGKFPKANYKVVGIHPVVKNTDYYRHNLIGKLFQEVRALQNQFNLYFEIDLSSLERRIEVKPINDYEVLLTLPYKLNVRLKEERLDESSIDN